MIERKAGTKVRKHGTARNPQEVDLAVGAARYDEWIVFERQFRRLRGDFCRALARQYSPRTVRRHRHILQVFCDYLGDETAVTRLEQVTKGMVNCGFRRWYHHKVWDRTSDSELRATLQKFFRFLAQKKGIENARALEALR
jgi:site-specific recombinase XerD